MDTRALKRLLLLIGIPITIAALILMRRVHADSTAMEVALIALFALGAFLTISGLVGTLTEPPRTDEELAEEAAARSATADAAPRTPSVTTAMGAYIFVLAAVAGVVVGVAMDDAGAGIQTFTFGVILGGVVFGLGFLLGHRPTAEE